MHKFLSYIKINLFAPVVLILWTLCHQSKKKLIEEDMANWSNWKGCNSGLSGLFFLFGEYPEIRSLFYYRIGHLSYLFSWLVRGQSCLYFRSTNIAGGMLVQHGFATIIDAEKIGVNCKIFQQVTIGYNGCERPVIGDNVIVCAGAKILGGITIGNNVIIGANAVVVKDVASNCVVGGVPAHFIKHTNDNTK